MASTRYGERANSFAMACSLLSRYVKQNSSAAAAGELGLGIRADAHRTSTTMSLLAGGESEMREVKKETMELFPQSAGFGSETGVQEASDAREKEKRQLTIFYGGKVLVFDNFTAEKAKDLMQLASKGSSTVQNFGLPPSSTTATVTDSTKVAVPALASALLGAQANVQSPARPSASDLPIARKASLHRFLEKRKDRLNAKAPYQVSPSDATPVKKEQESQPWLGLGQQATKPGPSFGTERSQ